MLEGRPLKGYDLEQAIRDIKNQVGKDTIILSVLNGVESEKQIAAVYGSGLEKHGRLKAIIT